MAEPSPTLPSHPSVQSDAASESFIVPSDSLTSAVSSISRPQSPAGEKQGLLEALDQAHKALDNARSENDDLKEQLAASQREVQDQSNQIAMLRGKVEEARRGVMRLQTENRRHSQLAGATNLQEVRTAKRASFILPPTPASPGGISPGGGKHIHRRISSMSEPGFHNDLRMVASPPSFATSFPESISGRVTPPTPPGPSAEEFAKLRAELTACQQSLQEATDAREASETAVRALRDFIAENAVGESKSSTEGGSEGLQGLRLPPLPTDVDVADSEASAPQKAEEPKRGWGSWLKRENSNSSTSKPAPPAVPALSIRSSTEDDVAPATTPATTPLTNFVSSWTRSVSSSAETSPATAPEPAPAQQSAFRKFSLFSRSSSNAASNPPSQTQTQYEAEPEHEEPKHIPPPLQLHREGSVRDSVSSATVSDAPEPISPPAELVDIALDRDRRFAGKEDYPGERTPTVGSATGFAM